MLTMAYKNGKPSNDILVVLAKEILMIWKRVGRAIKLDETDLVEIDLDVKGVYEKSYQMLKRWTQSQGSDATYEVLARALLHPTVNRYDLVMRFCITGEETAVKELMTGILNLSVDEDDTMPQSVKPIMILPGKPFHKTYERGKELKILDQMYTSLDTEGCADDVVMVYITGPPGSGKSQLSRSYGNWYGQREGSNESTVVVTLHAETPESLLESYKRLASAMHIQIRDTAKCDEIWQKLNAYALVVKRVLRNSKHYSFKWLFIVDNIVASNPLKEFWPLPGYGWGRGRVLVTTQDSELAPSAHEQTSTLSLSQGMDKEDAISFLCLISELDRDKFTSEVAGMLNYYPLSLACAAVFVRDMRKDRPAANFSWENYLSILEKYQDRLKYSEFTEHNVCYPRSMLTAAFCSASRMAESSSVLKSAFEFLSLCTLQPVPLDLLKEAILSSKEQQDLIPDLVKKEIAKCSLLIYPQNGARGIEVITIHQVMRTVFVQLRMESCQVAMKTAEPGTTIKLLDRERIDKFLRVLCNYYHRFRSSDNQAISTRILLSPHLQACIDTAQTHAPEVFIDTSVCLADSLIHTVGGTDYHRVQILELAHKAQKRLGLKDFCACRLLTDLGYTYREAGKVDKVIPVLEEANSIVQQFQDEEGMKQKSQILNVLGFTYRESYELELAEEYMSMCVDVTKQVYGKIHEEVVERLCNYGIILHDRWQNERAVEVLEEARTMAESLGSDLPICAQVYNYTAKVFLRWFLGLIYTEGMTEKSIKYLNKSKDLHERALQIYKNLHGKEHKFYAGTMMTYSMVLRHVGEIETALAHCKEAVRIYRSSGHIAWPRALTWLADICFAKGEFDVAKDYLEQAIEGDAEFGTTTISPGAFHPRALLAEALLKTGPKERGILILKECIDEWKKKGMHPQHYWIVRAQAVLNEN